MPSRSRGQTIVAIAAFVATVSGTTVSGATVSSTTTVSPPTLAAAPEDAAAPAALSWRACGDGFQCSTLPVPLDDANDKGMTIDLAVVERPARDRRKRIGSLVVNPGGPGLSGITYLR